jgi:hypothetical protein
MSIHIDPIPKLPEALRIAASTRRVVPFIGAGVSQLGGSPGWDEFANRALKFFVTHGKLSHAALDQIMGLTSRVKLSVALDLESRHGLPIDFSEILKPSTEDKKNFCARVYEDLSRLADTFVTTNYDEWLDQARVPFYKYEDLSMRNFDVSKAVFHIHGSVLESESMVRTTDEYLVRYANHKIAKGPAGENTFLTFLEKLFELKTILFIGYSLSELEVLEYVLQKKGGGISNEGIEQKHFILHGFFTHQFELAQSLKEYFAKFGVELIPFSRDEHDWNQLANVIEYLARELQIGNPLAVATLQEMKGLLE